MWIFYAALTVLFWGSSNVFFKKSIDDDGTAIDLITYNGIVFFIMTIIYALVKGASFNFYAIIHYLLAGLCYIAALFSFYAALKYQKVSLVSPIANCSCVITSLLCVLLLKQSISLVQLILIFIIVASIILISKDDSSSEKISRNCFILGLGLALGYTFLDGLGSFFDEVYIDKYVCSENVFTEDDVILSYATIYFIASMICLTLKLFRDKKKGIINKNYFKPNRFKLIGTVLETLGQYAYVYTFASSDAAIASPFVSSYCAISIILSRIFLKEKISKKQTVLVTLIIICMFILCTE